MELEAGHRRDEEVAPAELEEDPRTAHRRDPLDRVEGAKRCEVVQPIVGDEERGRDFVVRLKDFTENHSWSLVTSRDIQSPNVTVPHDAPAPERCRCPPPSELLGDLGWVAPQDEVRDVRAFYRDDR